MLPPDRTHTVLPRFSFGVVRAAAKLIAPAPSATSLFSTAKKRIALAISFSETNDHIIKSLLSPVEPTPKASRTHHHQSRHQSRRLVIVGNRLTRAQGRDRSEDCSQRLSQRPLTFDLIAFAAKAIPHARKQAPSGTNIVSTSGASSSDLSRPIVPCPSISRILSACV